MLKKSPFSENRRNLGDRKCLPKRRSSFVEHPSAKFFDLAAPMEFINAHRRSKPCRGILSAIEMFLDLAVFTLRLDWNFPGLDYLGMKSLGCTLGSADKRPFYDVASATASYRPLDERLVARASTVATAFRLRGCFFLCHPSPEYGSPQSHLRFGSPLLENRSRDQCEAC